MCTGWNGLGNTGQRPRCRRRNRLTRTDSRVNGGSWVTNRQVQTYNVAGNILTKTGLGAYTYGSTRPHAVTSAGGVTYTYDANGNVISDTSGRAFHYTSYDLVRRVSQGTAHTEFHYDAGRQRTLKRELSGTTVTSRTHYLGGVEVVWNGSSPGTGTGQYRRTIGGVLIATFFQSTGVTQQRYLHRDHLGSIVAISDETGQVVTWMAFDPWGLRRNADAWHPWNEPPSVYLNAMLAITPRGYTGHEHVDSAGIIHMNGRIYDPVLGRFLQADPFVEDSTTLNRYTYVHNNPLAYTDPSGYFSLKKAFRTIVSIGVAVAAGILTAGAGFTLTGFMYATLGGALSGGIAAGSIEGALWGAFAGAVFFGIGAGFDQLAQANLTAVGKGELAAGKLVFNTNLRAGQYAAQAVSHGIAGGTISEMQGGKFGHGFLSAGISKAVTPGIASSSLNTYQQGFALAIVGGTVSKISGGKFANGAVTAAMAFAFNQLQAAAEIRRAEKIYVTGHRVGKAGPYHLAIEYTDDSGPHWISAGPEDGLLVSGQDLQRPTDKPVLNVTIGEVSPPNGVSVSDYFQELQKVDLQYCDCVDYDLFPRLMDSYNSNSYVSGLIQATGGTSTVNLSNFVGGAKPLPHNFFQGK